MKVGDLVRHKEISSIGLGIVTGIQGPRPVSVQWSNTIPNQKHPPTGASLESNSMLEVISDGSR